MYNIFPAFNSVAANMGRTVFLAPFIRILPSILLLPTTTILLINTPPESATHVKISNSLIYYADSI